ncbi:MAG: redoxin domain-containing protein [Acidobacteriota bacterium]
MKLKPLILIVVLLFAIAAIATAIYFRQQNVELQSRLEKSNSSTTSQNLNTIKRLREGDVLPEFTALDTEGREIHVAERGKGNTLLFIYDPNCDRCEAGIPAWVKTNDRLIQLKVPLQVVALSVADSYTTVQHARKIKMPFVVVPFPSIELQKQYGVTEVPLTVIVDAKGTVQAVWDKPLDKGEIGDLLEVVCPHCAE